MMNVKIIKKFGMFVLSAALISQGILTASAIDLMTNTQNNGKRTPIVLACGQKSKANCNKVVATLSSSFYAKSIDVDMGETNGSVQSAQIVCSNPDVAPAMVGQRDAVTWVISDNSTCFNKLGLLGDPLNPYYAYMIVPGNSSASDIWNLARNGTSSGKAVTVYAGEEGSGGRVTLRYILGYDATLRNGISIADIPSAELANDNMKNGSLGAIFIMDFPNSPKIHEYTDAKDKDGKPLYKVLTLNLTGTFTNGFYNTVKDWNNKAMYQRCFIPGSNIETVCVDNVFVISTKYINANPGIVKSIRQSIVDTEASIKTMTGTPQDWSRAR